MAAACRIGGAAAQLRITVSPRLPDSADGRRDLVVGRAAAREGAQVVPRRREQAEIELALRRQPRTRTGAAKGARDARDDADLAAAIGVAPALRRLGGRVRFERHE